MLDRFFKLIGVKHWHHQCLDKKDRLWRHGRAWFSFTKKAVRLEWALGDVRFGIGWYFHPSEREITFRFTVPFLSTWSSLNGIEWEWLWEKTKRRERNGQLRKYGTDRDISISVHSWALWIHFWHDQMESRREDPWYYDIHWAIDDFFLGRRRYENVKNGDPQRIWIPLPEGEYAAEAQFETSIWRRSYWPWWPLKLVRESTRVDVQSWGGLPHEGKGESGYDCGRDGLFGYSGEGHSLEKAIAYGVESTLRDRKRYGGSRPGSYPNPVIADAAGVRAFAEHCARVMKAYAKYPKYPKVSWTMEEVSDRGIVLVWLVREGEGKTVAQFRSDKLTFDGWNRALQRAMKAKSTDPEEDHDAVAEATT